MFCNIWVSFAYGEKIHQVIKKNKYISIKIASYSTNLAICLLKDRLIKMFQNRLK